MWDRALRRACRARPDACTPAAVPSALDLVDDQLPVTDRPTIPVPAPIESEVRLKVTRVAWVAATVDIVVADLSRDPRSETYYANDVSPLQNERPPSTSTVRALK
jgi:hypothetical protein